ncbi:MAG: tRNA sulfurtransferase [Desulfurococcales archaeon]|nr:tRNA sulfurtransferase [Desulfurococcales archaeon]MCE4626490.1 tRNA sulfurtransferase [Desulfurococcales archaeon]MCE4629495.1 tRNA sulfurtransferase [Desulfurococcales archaeon]
MEEVVIVRYSEIAVKGRHTRPRLERLLAKHIEEAMRRRGVEGRVERLQGRILIRDPSDSEKAAISAARVFGVKSTSPAKVVDFNGLDDLVEKAAEHFAPRVEGKVFRVTARRTGVHDFTSLDVEKELGARLLELGANRVDLHRPDYIAYVEVRGNRAYLYDRIIEGPGGLPLGSEEPTLVLFSGGFDSTAAAWLVMKRGSPADLVFFDIGVREVYNIMMEAAEALAREWIHGRRLKLYVVDFRDVASTVASNVRPKYRVLVMRRLMLVEAERIAVEKGYEALVTGESIGQVATQTVRNMRLIGSGVTLPVVRPVSGMDKDEVVRIVHRIGLYDIVSRQIEACRMGVDPTPRGDPAIFNDELGKVLGKYRIQVSEYEIGG